MSHVRATHHDDKPIAFAARDTNLLRAHVEQLFDNRINDALIAPSRPAFVKRVDEKDRVGRKRWVFKKSRVVTRLPFSAAASVNRWVFPAPGAPSNTRLG